MTSATPQDKRRSGTARIEKTDGGEGGGKFGTLVRKDGNEHGRLSLAGALLAQVNCPDSRGRREGEKGETEVFA